MDDWIDPETGEEYRVLSLREQTLVNELANAHSEVERLRKALEFYVQADIYEERIDEAVDQDGRVICQYSQPFVLDEAGAAARVALSAASKNTETPQAKPSPEAVNSALMVALRATAIQMFEGERSIFVREFTEALSATSEDTKTDRSQDIPSSPITDHSKLKLRDAIAQALEPHRGEYLEDENAVAESLINHVIAPVIEFELDRCDASIAELEGELGDIQKDRDHLRDLADDLIAQRDVCWSTMGRLERALRRIAETPRHGHNWAHSLDELDNVQEIARAALLDTSENTETKAEVEALHDMRLAAKILGDLDRSPAGRKRGDVESQDPTGVSQGNPLLPPGTHIGYTMGGKRIVVPERTSRIADWVQTSENTKTEEGVDGR